MCNVRSSEGGERLHNRLEAVIQQVLDVECGVPLLTNQVGYFNSRKQHTVHCIHGSATFSADAVRFREGVSTRRACCPDFQKITLLELQT